MIGACLLALHVVISSAQGTTHKYPPGWNGLAQKPPLEWRSWNAFGARITQEMMTAAIDALAAKIWTIDGKANTSLLDVGYDSVGVDEGWEGCGHGAQGSRFHDAKGFPVVNAKFPDLKKLVDYGHSKGVKMGWYLNGCACGEHHATDAMYVGDIKRLHDFGFDGVKIDGCGAQVNMTRYAELMQESGSNYTIENCHWGRCGPFQGNPDGSSCPTVDWCPFNWYRTSGDINAGHDSWLRNLQTARRFLESKPPLSRPGCWAYPDMLEVGRVQGSLGWNRAHFGAWCVVSAPLVLGLDITDTKNLAKIVPFITNSEALNVNQQWAGHPGRRVMEVESGALQVWSKPQPRGALAVLVINSGTGPYAASLELSKLGLTGTVTVRDIWEKKDLAEATGKLMPPSIPGTDSGFYLLTPKSTKADTTFVV